MSADRELLELAAKAAGYKFHENDGQLWVYYDGTGFRIWNPRDDDGDALRLAVKLNICIRTCERHVTAWFDGGSIGVSHFECGGDHYVATRHAILRAAAEVGRAMP